MFHFRSDTHAPAYGIVFDIGSGSVGAAIVESNRAQSLPTLIYTTRAHLRVGTTPADARRVREALLAASLTASQEGIAALRAYNPKARLTRMLVTCGSPWSYTAARNVSYENDEPFRVTKNILSDLSESAEREIIDHARTAESSHEVEEYQVVERATTDISINEYPVVDPTGKSATICSLSHMVGLVPRDILESLHEVHGKLFPETSLVVHTYLLSLYCVLRDLYPQNHAFTIIDVTGESTEIGIVENNLLVENAHTAYGSSTLIRTLMDKTKSPASDIESRIAARADGHHTESDDITEEMHAYQERLVEALNAISARRTPPKHLVVTVRHPYRQLFGDSVRSALTTSIGTDPIDIDLAHSLLYEVSTMSSSDPHIGVIARFFHKLHGCGELSDI